MADDVTVMPPGERPLSGREEIYAAWSEGAGDDGLEWEPQGGSVSQAGDLGWTWGIWVFTTRDAEGQGELSYGKYVFIWKKVDGDWKIVANIWNDNPAPE
jgi:ketosteroid isomerase-like protein